MTLKNKLLQTIKASLPDGAEFIRAERGTNAAKCICLNISIKLDSTEYTRALRREHDRTESLGRSLKNKQGRVFVTRLSVYDW